MEGITAHDLDLKRKWYDFECNIFNMFPEEDYLWMKRPEYARFQKKVDGKYEPSIQFESAYAGKCFWIDCIYASSFNEDGSLCVYPENDYIERMRDYDLLEDPIFLAICVGDSLGSNDDFIFDHISEFAFHTINKNRFRELVTPYDLDSIEDRIFSCL